jgi:hypothetical protein
VVTVGDEGRAVEAASSTEPHLGRDLVPEAADGPGDPEREQVVRRVRADDFLDRKYPRDAGVGSFGSNLAGSLALLST